MYFGGMAVLLVLLRSSLAQIRERFVTSLCPGSVGPTYGDVLRFDSNSQQDVWVIPSTDLDCYVTLRGYQTQYLGPQRYVSLQWRSSVRYPFSFIGYNDTAATCTSAYIEIFQGTTTGAFGPLMAGPLCGTSAPGTVELISTGVIILHFYIKAPPSGTYNMTNIPGQEPCSNGTANCYITPDDRPGPFINFTADFTSYSLASAGSCSVDPADSTQLYCSPGTSRCIDTSLQCDYLGANNCGDSGDQSVKPPGNCVYTTVTPPTTTASSSSTSTTLKRDLLPLWIVLGVLAGLLLAYWCCWRPGWLIWRLGRLRNVQCCKPCCGKCQRSTSCRKLGCFGPPSGLWGRCCKGCHKTKSGYPYKHPAYNNAWHGKGNVNHTVDESGNPAGWLKFASDDGGHVREMR